MTARTVCSFPFALCKGECVGITAHITTAPRQGIACGQRVSQGRKVPDTIPKLSTKRKVHMVILRGQVVQGWKHFSSLRLGRDEFRAAYRKATGGDLWKGTLNVQINQCIPVKEHFRIRGKDISEPEQDLLFEICRVNGIWGFRIRPYILCTGAGGHGDNIFEIGFSQDIVATEVQIELFRDDIEII
jgi:hypothetical protein